MKAAITDGKGGVSLQEVPMPTVGPYDCLVKTEVCLFCNATDRHLVEGSFPFGQDYPAIMGHESVGVVESVGEKVRNFAVGDRVIRPFAIYPDDVEEGMNSAWGGLAEYGKVGDWQAMADDQGCEPSELARCLPYQQKVPAEIAPAQAAMMIAQKEVYSAAAKITDVEGKSILVSGAGIVGFYFGVFLRMRGARVTVTARRQEQLDFALEHGAADSIVLIGDVTGSHDVMVETTGSLDVAKSLIHAISKGGRICTYGIYDGMTDDSVFDELRKNHEYVRVDPSEAEPHEEICKLAMEGVLPIEPIITHTFPLAEIKEAWKTVIEKRTMKTLVTM
jgi:threonine dehydrogenase-like Zn-dependent dehydrogenase